MRQERDAQFPRPAGDRKAPRSHRYDGVLYARLIDPMNARLRERVAREVEPGATVLDVGCGTGALAARLAAKAPEVAGSARAAPLHPGSVPLRAAGSGSDRATFLEHADPE